MSAAPLRFSQEPVDVVDYAAKVHACWVGKAIGGTLGQSFEGFEGPIDATFYEPVPETMVPNDDLDVQVVYARCLEDMDRPRVARALIAQMWRRHLRFPWHEYAVAKRNLKEGIEPPHTGAFDNWFAAGEGAVIRTELWACLAPGDPDRAAAYAYEDACFDHAGDGIWAAVFMAALQSMAFVEPDLEVLLDRATQMLPISSTIRQVVHDTRVWASQGEPWQTVMERIRDRYGNADFSDSRMNTGFVVLGLVASGMDFERAILITNGCGGDTDSTTASVGSLLAIISPESLPHRWREPIGEDLVLHPQVVGIRAPATLAELTQIVVRLRERLDGVWPDAKETDFDAAAYALPVTVGWHSPVGILWGGRDVVGLAPEGAPEPAMPSNAVPTTVAGTWTRWAREDFCDRVLLIDYTIDLDHDVDGVLMFNCTEHTRVWLDGEYLFGSGPGWMFPTQHRPPAGQGTSVSLAAGRHRLRAMILRPPAERPVAEWVVGLAEQPHMEWVPHAFRPASDVGDVRLTEDRRNRSDEANGNPNSKENEQ